MTLAFVFKIKDAWVIVTDKRTISEVKTTESAEEIKFFSDNKIKIKKLDHHLFFVGAGQEEYLEKIMEVINNSDDFDDFKDNLWIKMGEVYEGLNSKIEKDEEFIVVNQTSQKAFKFDTRDIKENGSSGGVLEIAGDCIENNFIGFFDINVHKGISELRITSFRNQSSKKVKEPFYDSCNNLLSSFSIDALKEVGHPSVQGSNIWIISKDNLKKVFTFPKNNYDYEVNEE